MLLGALGTGFAYVWHFEVLHAWGATRASTVTYVTPVVGVVLGVTILGERFSWNEPLGALARARRHPARPSGGSRSRGAGPRP